MVETTYSREQFISALRSISVIARGPKPVAVLREWDVPIALTAPEPNTWRELLRAFDENSEQVPLRGRRVAVQAYGAPNPELLAGLADRGADVTSLPVYEWGMPEDLAPLRAAVAAIATGKLDVVLFTTAMQVNHLLQIAKETKQEDAVRVALSQMAIASIGPVTSERLREYGINVDMEPTHPKMGFLVGEAAHRSADILTQKRFRED